ncbi:Arylsulfatase [Pontiella desulfatans]|uniref:Arylsulfatase n=1 Tax=Pontiella desulfatans TaxID=2750659 RepID=A0A6C2U8J4_PONDE|nr:sulfatase [Pontiella desulfatans]SPS74053.1 sulfatase S1_7 [Kiritimatiellales bacterium]VGO16432.1 Arylsulfatase [Pontiella desulfatans]
MKKIVYMFAVLAVSVGVIAAESKPNVLFIAVDDLKPWLGCYDHPVVKTPNIDRLAASGTVFRNTYCQVALCGPSRMSVLTGLRPDTTGIYSMGSGWASQQIGAARERVPGLKTIPQYFKEHGYTSLGFGKVFDSRNTDKHQDAVSWSNKGGVRWDWNTDLYPLKPVGGGYQDPVTRKILDEAYKEVTRLKMEKPQRTAYLSTIEGARPVCEALDLPDEAYAEGNVMTAPALEVIRQHSKNGKPFFLAVGYYKPHLPFVAPKKYWDLYDPEEFEIEPVQVYPKDGVAVAETDYIEARGFHPVPEEGPIPEALQRHMLHGYAACVSYVDAQVGKLLQALEESGVADNTIICLWGDHGFHLGDKQVWGKHTNYEQATEAPLIISSPAIPGGVVEDAAMTELVDLFPTLCELAGLEAPEKTDGRSLAGIMRGEELDAGKSAISQYMRQDEELGSVMGWAMRTSRYRYVEWRRIVNDDGNVTWSGNVVGCELYDYKNDPNETRNLATSIEHRGVMTELQQEFDRVMPHLPDRSLDTCDH